jgi:DNA processing protein
MDHDELAAWVRLLETPGVGRESARRLLAAFGSAQSVFSASTAAHREVAGAGAATALGSLPQTVVDLTQATVEWLRGGSEQSPRSLVHLGDPHYPSVLLETADPPLMLYAQGDTTLLQTPSVAVVGSRKPTPQGTESARAFSAELSQAGLTVISGMALGVDGAAHRGGLSGRGRTVAVVGTGLDRVYPRRHLELARELATHALIVSEYSLGTPPLAQNFPQRNRIIAGLAKGTLVVEAALQSGSLITARLAAEAGRDVFAIPGSIHSPQSRGCHALIKQGAKLVESTQDILEEMNWARQSPPATQTLGTSDEVSDPLLDALGFGPVTLDALVARTGWPASELNVRLLDLELAGQVARLPGQLFQRVAAG